MQTILNNNSISPFLQPLLTSVLSISINLPYLSTTYKCNHRIFVLLYLAFT